MGNALLAAGFTRVQLPVMIAIGLAESGGDPTAEHVNADGSIDYGAWQINSVHGFDVTSLLTLYGNAKAAKAVYDQQGYGAWTVFRTGTYRNRLGDVGSAAQDANAEHPASPASGGVRKKPIFGEGGYIDITGVPTWAKPIVQAFSFLTALGNPDFWRRVGIVVLGVLLLIMAAVWLLRKPAEQAVKVAEEIRP